MCSDLPSISACFAIGLSVLLLCLRCANPGVCQTAFAALRCRELGEGVSVLEADYTVDCNSSDYQMFRLFAIFMIVLIPVGIPVAVLVILRKHEDKILAQDPDTIREFNAILGDYEPEYLPRENCCKISRRISTFERFRGAGIIIGKPWNLGENLH